MLRCGRGGDDGVAWDAGGVRSLHKRCGGGDVVGRGMLAGWCSVVWCGVGWGGVRVL